MSFQELMDILYSQPNYLSTKAEDLPLFIKRVKKPTDPLSKLKFEPNKIARRVFQIESFYEAVLWRINHRRINHKLYTGETGEGKTTIMIGDSVKFTKEKKRLLRSPNFWARNLGLAKKIEFSIPHNFLLGQFISLKSQIIYSKFLRWEEIDIDEIYLCLNRMRSTSGQNIDAKNSYNAGRFRYNPFNGSAPSIGSLDKEVSATMVQWNVIAEYNHHKKKVVDVIVKYNVHSRDNYQYRWVDFIEMQVGWCEERLYKEAEEIKRKMIETHEGLVSKKAHLREELDRLEDKQKKDEDLKAQEIIDLFKDGKIDRKEAAWRIFNEVKASYNYVKEKIGSSWETAKKYIQEKEKEYEEGTLTEEQRKDVID